MDGDDEVWLGVIQSRFDWGQSEGTLLRVSNDPNEHVRYMRLGSVPKQGEAGRCPRATYAAGDQIVVRYSEPGCLTRTSPATSPVSQGEKIRSPTDLNTEDAGPVPTEAQAEDQRPRVNLKEVYRDPVGGGRSGGKSYKKKRPVAPASGDRMPSEKKSKTATEDDRPRKKAAPTSGQISTVRPAKTVVPVKAASPVVDLAASSSGSDEGEDN
jgi:hypothetical protein